ncbi:MAG TPA: hypothetical protein VEJ63_14235 [Planctomycetota bacterium]|nr:hypothetical protein [Planctomycetota bacterium]
MSERAHSGMQVWVFMGEKGQYPMGVWSSLPLAHRYIHDQALTGSLTAYELDLPAYEAAINSGQFKPSKDQHRSHKFRQTFSNRYQEHYNFREGHCASLGNPQYATDEE